MLADVTLYVCVCVCVCAQSQLSACSKALESSEELLELANQTLCSSETDGFTQVTDPVSLPQLFPLLAVLFFFLILFQRSIVDFIVHVYMT